MKKISTLSQLYSVAPIVLIVNLFMACGLNSKNQNAKQIAIYKHDHVMTKSEQDSLTPEKVLQDFIAGNDRFKKSNVTQREHSSNIRKIVTGGQFPKAIVLSCLDSRVPVEDVFDQGLGDVFVGRIAGNFVNTDLLGSMEFACKVSGAKLIIIMGHQHCGAIKGAIDNVELGNITAMLANIKPAVEMSNNFTGEKSSKNEAYVKDVNINNIRNSISKIRTKSSILKEMEDLKQIKIIGLYYSLLTGKLEYVN